MDCHLGAWRNPKLRDLNLKAFEQTISKCITETVNFIVITGDFFDINIPDLVPVKRAVEILKNAKDKGIEIYIIYGSHDFSPNTVSMIDILHSAGLFTKPVQMEQVGNKLRLKFLSDTATGAKITGLSSVETRTVRVLGESKEEIEERLIKERIGSFKVHIVCSYLLQLFCYESCTSVFYQS